ncbi:MAG: EAL and HDOD domain-containing protein [Jatrophihabitantaceae bacterium]
MTDVVVGRQPIFDRALRTVGYELLFRNTYAATDSGDADLDGDQMTTEVLFGALSIGIHRLVGDKMIFYNADRGALTGSVPVWLPPGQTVVEVLESVVPDEDVIGGCQELQDAGYRLALDDFVWFDGAEALLARASIVKVDIQLLGPEELLELIARCRTFDVQLLAEKVETQDELARCMELGFELFQGYALARPAAVAGRALTASLTGRLRLSAALLQDDLDFAALDRIVRTEPALAFQLMQIASIGPPGGTRRQVRTIREALVLLGAQRLRSWLLLLTLRSASPTSHDDLITVLIRARTCELLASELDAPSGAFAFTAGMMSAFDRLLGIGPDEVIEILSPDEELRDAAFGTCTPMGRLVHEVIDYESGRLADHAAEQSLEHASARAIEWALHTGETLSTI